MKPASAKNKGREGQKLVAGMICQWLGLPPEDVRSRPMGSPGADIMLSERAMRAIPFDIEVKSLAAFSAFKILQQAEARSEDPPLAVVKVNNNSRPVAVLYF